MRAHPRALVLSLRRTGAQKGPQGGLRIEYDGARANGAAQQAVRTVPIDLALLREHWTVKAQPSADSKVGAESLKIAAC